MVLTRGVVAAALLLVCVGSAGAEDDILDNIVYEKVIPVSYTHLTLPTN